jgi:hypothetical protein
MKKRIFLRYLLATLILVIIGWAALTIYVEIAGPSKQWRLQGENAKNTALVVFDPDPFYNLDEQICISFGEALKESGFNVYVATVVGAEQFKSSEFDVIIYCANTYNWRPDWSITSFIKDNKKFLTDKNCVAITLGAGSTETSQKYFEEVIENNGGKLIASYSLWLWRPNDETKMEQPNVDVAVDMAHTWGKQIAQKIKKQYVYTWRRRS